MPWARLHGLRGYRDLLVESLEADAPWMIDVVPVLIEQLNRYAAGGDDDHLRLTATPASELSPAEVTRLRHSFVGGHPAMRAAHPTWDGLAKRLSHGDELSVASLRDAQVWSTLAWFGATALRDYPALVQLRRKAQGFTEQDKAELLAVQADVLASLPRLLASASQAGLLVGCALHHPILPLLVDTRHARRSLPNAPTDVGFAWPEDALRHLVEGRAALAALGRAPRGLWPPEGAVSPEVVELAAQAGYTWLASDEEVLARSGRDGAGLGPWDLGHGMRGFFRDRDLSDRIGFRYATVPASEAVADLVNTARRRGGLRPVILDGENPWESFPDAGAAFRDRLLDALRTGPVRGVRLDAAAQEPACGVVSRLHTGSWIRGDLSVWFGHPADHAAWRALAEARAAIEQAPQREAGLTRLLPAEASDWTWWYGEDFDTPFAADFDALYRAHLQAAWRAAGLTPPTHLDAPLVVGRQQVTPPRGLVEADLSGVVRWVHWANAGRALPDAGGAMAVAIQAVREVRFGWDEGGRLWALVCLDAHRAGGAWRIWVGETVLELEDEPGACVRGAGVSAVHARAALVIQGPAEANTLQIEHLGHHGEHTTVPAGAPWRLRADDDASLAVWSV